MAKIHEHADLRGFSIALILNATEGLTSPDTTEAVEALIWLFSKHYAMWAEITSLPMEINIKPTQKIAVNRRSDAKRSLNPVVSALLKARIETREAIEAEYKKSYWALEEFA